jgi:hypothetical protein
MCAAATQSDLEAELSNLLHHLYRLGELCKTHLGMDRFYESLVSSDDLRAARAAMWARTFDTHDIVAVASVGDVYSEFYTEMYGVLVWKPLEALPEQTDKYKRHLDYRYYLQNRPVLDTTRRAFDALAAQLQDVSNATTHAPISGRDDTSEE